MKALILAAGLGTRLGTLTADRPKPMLPVAGRPLLEHSIALLREHGVRDIAINLHHLPDVIVNHFGDGLAFGVALTYSHEDQLLGTAGAARRLDWFLDETFCVVYGDVLTDIDVAGLAQWHRDRASTLTLALSEVEDPTRAGIVAIDDAGRVVRFQEKPRADEVFSTLASSGVLIAEPDLLADIPVDTVADFGLDVIPSLLGRGAAVHGRIADGYVLDIGGTGRYEQAQSDARVGRVRLYGSDAALNPPLSVERALMGAHQGC